MKSLVKFYPLFIIIMFLGMNSIFAQKRQQIILKDN